LQYKTKGRHVHVVIINNQNKRLKFILSSGGLIIFASDLQGLLGLKDFLIGIILINKILKTKLYENV